MNIKKRRWNELLVLGMAVLVLIITGTVQIANAYEYIEYENWATGYNESGVQFGEIGENFWYSRGDTQAYAEDVNNIYNDRAYCSCGAIAGGFTGGCEISLTQYAVSEAAYMVEWVWNGPPGEAPGGTLSWVINGSGSSQVEGNNYLGTTGDTAYSESSGSSYAMGLDTEFEETNVESEAWGWVVNKSNSDCDFSISANPINVLTIKDYGVNNDYKSYNAYVEWDFDNEDDVTITAGTTYVFFTIGIICESNSEEISTGTGNSHAYAYNEASILVEDADFDY